MAVGGRQGIVRVNPTSVSNAILEILDDPPRARKLQMELAVTIDAMYPFVRATYVLEVDGPLMSNYDTQAISTENVDAAAKKLANGDSRHEQQLITYAFLQPILLFEASLKRIFSRPYRR